MNKYNTDYVEGYNYQYKLDAIEKSKSNLRCGFRDTIYNLLLFQEFTHVIRWYISHIGIKTQYECGYFFTEHLRDFQIREHIEQIREIIHSFEPNESNT